MKLSKTLLALYFLPPVFIICHMHLTGENLLIISSVEMVIGVALLFGNQVRKVSGAILCTLYEDTKGSMGYPLAPGENTTNLIGSSIFLTRTQEG